MAKSDCTSPLHMHTTYSILVSRKDAFYFETLALPTGVRCYSRLGAPLLPTVNDIIECVAVPRSGCAVRALVTTQQS